MDNIIKLLEKKHRNGKHITHYTSGITVDAAWSLSNSSIIKLMNKYNEEYLEEDINILENNLSIMPIIVDFEFKFDKKKNFVLPYDIELICAIVGCCQHIITDMFNVNDVNSKYLYCHYLTYNKLVKGPDYMMQKCRLFFPYFKCSIDDVLPIFKASLLKMLRSCNAMRYFFTQPINSWEEIIDFGVCKKPIALYGSQDLNKRKLIFERIITYIDMENFDVSCAELDIIDIDQDTFDPYDYSLLQNEENEELIIDESKLENYLPILYSVHYPKDQLMLIIKNKEIVDSEYKEEIHEYEDDEISRLKILLPMLNKKRFKDKTYARKIGAAIFNTYEKSYRCRGSPEAYKLFKTYMLKYNDKNNMKKYDKDVFENYYRLHNSLSTVAVYAYEDNPKMYKEWFNKWCEEALNESIVSTKSGAVAEAFYRHYWLDFICSNEGKDYVWYYYYTPLWKEDFKSLAIEDRLDKDFRRIYRSQKTIIENKMKASDDEGYTQMLANMKKKLVTIENNLDSNPFISSVCISLRKKFLVRDFNKKINTNDKLTAVRNGVIEIIGKDVIFRKGEHDDYLTVGFNAKYDKNMDHSHPQVQFLLSWFEKLYRDMDTLHYINKFNSSMLSPESLSLNKLFTIIDGTGDQGKSVLAKQYKATMGPMFKNMSGTYLTESRNGSANASPDIIYLAYARLIWFQEINPLKSFLNDAVKRLTGGDEHNGRQMFDKKYEDVVITAKVVVSTNKISRFDVIDTAVKNRFTRIHITTKFKKDAPTDLEQQRLTGIYPLDKKMGSNVIKNADGLLWLMFNNYKYFAKEGLDPSPHIVKYTAKYWELNDVYEIFIKATIRLSDSSRDKLAFDDIYTKFNEWHAKNYPKRFIPDSSFVLYYLSERWGEPEDGKWCNIKFKHKVVDDFEL